METHVGDLFQPVLHMLANMGLIAEGLPVEAVIFDILHPGFHFALALRVVAFASVDAEPRCRGIRMELLVKGQLAVLLTDHHQFGLVVHALFR